MDPVFDYVREGSVLQLRIWLDNPDHDLNFCDQHGFTLLHLACQYGHVQVVDLLLSRGATISSRNMGDDTPLHLAASFNHAQIAQKLISRKADVNAINEHGNTPLHYACFWNYAEMAELLVLSGALIAKTNKYGDAATARASAAIKKRISELAMESGQDLSISLSFNESGRLSDSSLTSTSTRSRDGGTLTRTGGHFGLKSRDLALRTCVAKNACSEVWRGEFQGMEIAAKIYRISPLIKRIIVVEEAGRRRRVVELVKRARVAIENEYPRLRLFSHINVLPVLGCSVEPIELDVDSDEATEALSPYADELAAVDAARVAAQLAIGREDAERILAQLRKDALVVPNFVLISAWMTYGSLYDVLHTDSYDLVVDQERVLRFAVDVAKGMDYLYSLEPTASRFWLNSRNVVVGEDLIAKLSMVDTKFSFQQGKRVYAPAWMSPEALQQPPETVNAQAADVWSFAILLWELSTREVPFAEFSALECGLKITREKLRLEIPPGFSRSTQRLIALCMNEEPGRRPTFAMLLPILEKMAAKA